MAALMAASVRWQLGQVRVVEGVVADGMAGVGDLPGDSRVGGGVGPGHEERRLCVLLF
jgi:hypothetical protein